MLFKVAFQEPFDDIADNFIVNASSKEEALKIAKEQEKDYQESSRSRSSDWSDDLAYFIRELDFETLADIIQKVQDKEIGVDIQKNIMLIN